MRPAPVYNFYMTGLSIRSWGLCRSRVVGCLFLSSVYCISISNASTCTYEMCLYVYIQYWCWCTIRFLCFPGPLKPLFGPKQWYHIEVAVRQRRQYWPYAYWFTIGHNLKGIPYLYIYTCRQRAPYTLESRIRRTGSVSRGGTNLCVAKKRHTGYYKLSPHIVLCL